MKYTFNISFKPVNPLVAIKLSRFVHRYMKEYSPRITKRKDYITIVFTIKHKSDVSFLDEEELKIVNKAKASDLIYFLLTRFKLEIYGEQSN